MQISDRILGSHTATQLRERTDATVLQIGRDHYSRVMLAGVKCFNFTAAQTLSKVLADLGVKDTRQLYDTMPPSVLAVPRIGAIALAVLGAAFEAKKIGTLESWVRAHADAEDVEAALVTFETMKRREAAEVAQEKKDKAARRRKRSQQAHTIRVDRFTDRQQAAAAS